jgi:peptidyl-prolyl cis-trans isomerase SurA
MKKLLIIPVLLFISAMVYSDVISEPMVSVNLIRPQMITSLEVDQKIALYNKQLMSSGLSQQNISRTDMLDSMISSILISQAAEKAGIKVSDIDINRVLQAQKQSAQAQLQQNINDEQFKQLIIRQTGSPWEEYISDINEQLIQQSYITQTKKHLFENITIPAEQEILNKYNENIQAFFNPEYIRVSMIFIPVLNKNVEKSTIAKTTLGTAYLELKNGSISFDDAVLKYSEEESIKYRGGDIGFVGRDNRNLKLQLGEGFFNEMFKLPVNTISKVLESNSGYHILKITKKMLPKLLTLTDQVKPDNPLIVRDYIKDGILQERQQEALALALREINSELRTQAEIIYF